MRRGVLLLVAALAVLALPAVPGHATFQRPSLVSANKDGTGSGNGNSGVMAFLGPCFPSCEPVYFADASYVSADGSHVAFDSYASDLTTVPDGNGVQDVFVRDLRTNQTAMVSVNRNGIAAEAMSTPVGISDDGRVVLFVSTAHDLVVTPTGASVSNYYVRDIVAGTTSLVNINLSGTAAASGSLYNARISGDGRFVAFATTATDTVTTPDANGAPDVFVRDLAAQATQMVSINRFGTAAANGSSTPSGISSDGQVVSFESLATDLVAVPDNNSGLDIFIRNVPAAATTLASANRFGMATANQGSELSVLSKDGSTVAFLSTATDTVSTADGNGSFGGDAYRRSVASGSTQLVSVNRDGTASANAPTYGPLGISDDGTVIIFSSYASDLTAVPDTNGTLDVFTRSFATNTTMLVDVNAAGTAPASGNTTTYNLSGNGSRAIYATGATDTVATPDTNGSFDVILRDLSLSTTTLISINRDGTAAGSGISGWAYGSGAPLDASGTTVAFSSNAPDLVAGDGNGVYDVFAAFDPGAARFAATSFSADEADGVATLTVVRNSAAGSGSVTLTTSDGTAVAGRDYTASSTPVTFAPGETSKAVAIPLVNDHTIEGPETFHVALGFPSGVGLGSPSAADVTITDDDTVPSFYFAEGTVRPGFVEFLTLQNPGSDLGTATVTFQAADDGGAPVAIAPDNIAVPASSRVTVNLNDYLSGLGISGPVNVSLQVTSDVPLVAERPLYFRTGLSGGVDGGTDVIGALAPAQEFDFAEGTVRPGFTEFLTLQNPGDNAGTATLSFQGSDDGGSAVPVPDAVVALPAASRVTVNVNDLLAQEGVPTPINVSVKVTSDVPVVAERPLYFHVGLAGGVDGGTDVIGAPEPAKEFDFAEGTVRPGFTEFLTLQNPGAAAGTATLAFQGSSDSGGNVPVPFVSVPVAARSRVTVNVNDYLSGFSVPTPVNLSVRVTSDVPIVAERPLYFNVGLAGGADGGTDVIGAPGPAFDFGLAEGTVRPGFTEFLTLQNPGGAPGTAVLTFQASSDTGLPVDVPPSAVPVPAGSRVTVNVNDYLASLGAPTPLNLSVHVTSDVRIVAERPLYFNAPLAGGVDGGTDVIGFMG